MKNFYAFLLFLFIGMNVLPVQDVAAKNDAKVDTFRFTTIKALPITPVKNQANSGTCWSYSGIGMIESELLRKGKGEYDLSEMYIVYKNYLDKAKKYVRMHGTVNFGAGGSFADVLDAIKDYGIVPQEAYEGLNYGTGKNDHSEMDAVLRSYVDVLAKEDHLTSGWYEGFKGILESYLGKDPEKFSYKGKEYTPLSFARELDIRPDDYVSLTSFIHHPFYSSFPIEVPDNWRWAYSYNLPLDELMKIIYNSIDKGYTVAWGSDVSEPGFTRNGIAILPDMDAKNIPGTDQARWLKLSAKEKDDYIKKELKGPMKEQAVTQESRQKGFDNYETTDDHGMLIFGTARDQNGTNYFLVKNSWSTNSKYKGIWYASDTFVRAKTLNIVVNKNAIPADIKEKLGIK